MPPLEQTAPHSMIEDPVKRKTLLRIQVCTINSIHPQTELLSILEELFPVKFILTEKSSSETPAEITYETVLPQSTQERARLTIQLNESEPLRKIKIWFNVTSDVPFPFRGRTIQTTLAGKRLIPNQNETVLAHSDQGAIWTLSHQNGIRHFRSGMGLPVLPPGGSLIDVLNGDHFLELIPMLHWLREICSIPHPVLKACFIFDDPNLHWPNYGFINFRELVKHASAKNYHVSIATIPLDTWMTHPATASLFIKHADRISLAVHGNNHTKLELARHYTPTQRTALLNQAIHRITRLERKFGLNVSKIMIPPHGACSEEMLKELPQCGFKAACISHGSLRTHNPTKTWTRSLGYHPFEVIEGCPIMPRWGISNHTNNTIYLAAYLGQAIILRGHHQDLKDGIEPLDVLADFINGLGTVSWSNLTDLWSDHWRSEHLPINPLAQKQPITTALIRRLLTEGRDRFIHSLL